MSTDEKVRRDALSQIKIYKFADRDNPPPTRVKDVKVRWEGWQPRGLEYFERLADILNREVVDERDRFSTPC